jgi:hypothetical protein
MGNITARYEGMWISRGYKIDILHGDFLYYILLDIIGYIALATLVSFIRLEKHIKNLIKEELDRKP